MPPRGSAGADLFLFSLRSSSLDGTTHAITAAITGYRLAEAPVGSTQGRRTRDHMGVVACPSRLGGDFGDGLFHCRDEKRSRLVWNAKWDCPNFKGTELSSIMYQSHT